MQETSVPDIRFEAILGIATALMLVGSLAPWASLNEITRNALSSWHGNFAFVGAILALFATTVTYRVYRFNFLQKYRPYTDGVVGMVGSVLALVGAFAFFSAMGSSESAAWGMYLTIIGGFVGVFASFGIYREGVPSIPKGLASKGISP